MATSGLIQGSVSQRTDRFRSYIYWADVSPSQEWRITNNASVVRVYSIVDTSISASVWDGLCMSYTQVIDGQSTTYGNFTSDAATSWTYTSATTPFGNGRYTEVIPTEVASYVDYTIPHNSDGTKTVIFTHSYSLPSGGYGPGNVSVNGSFVLDTIPRASQPTLDAATKDFGQTFTISTNRVSTSFTHSLSYSFGSASGSIATGVGTSTTWTASTALGSQIPCDMSGVGTITCDTYSGATLIGTKTVNFTLTVPTTWRAVLTTSHSGFSWINSPAQLTGYTIQGISTLTLTLAASLNSLVSSYGTTISAYQVRFSSYNSGELTYSNLAISKSAGLISVSGTQYAYYKVKDARGNWSNEVQEQVMGTGSTIYAYAAPVNNGFNVARNSTILTTANFQMNFAATAINSANTWSYQRQYFNGSTWVNIDASPVTISGYTITSTLTHSLPYAEATVYQVRVALVDKFSTVYYSDTLPTSDVPLVLTQYGAGIGKIPTGGGTYDLEVGSGGISSDGDILVPNDRSYDFVGSNATIRSNATGALVLAGTDVFLRPNGDTTTNQLIVPGTGPATIAGSTIWTDSSVKTSSVNIMLAEGKDLIIKASATSTTDPGDIVFQNASGVELQRVYFSGGSLYMRGIDGTGAYQIWNQQNLPYEQGLFTPRIDGGTTAGVGTYILQQGYYTKFGSMVLFSLAIQTSAHTGTGNIKVMLPWTGISTITQSVSLETNALTLTTGHVAYAEYRPGANYVSIVSSLTGTTALATINIDPACSIRISGVVQIA